MKSSAIFLLFLSAGLFVAAAADPVELIEILENEDTAGIVDCLIGNSTYCKKVIFDFDAFETAEEILLNNASIPMTNKSRPGADDSHHHSLFYESEDKLSWAILTFSDDLGFSEMNGFVNYVDGTSYTISNCGQDCHVLLDVHPNHILHPSETDVSESDESERALFLPQVRELLAQGRQDTSTVVTLVLNVFFTTDYRNSVSDPTGRIRNLVAMADSSMTSMRIPVRVEVNCIQEIRIGESNDGTQRLRDFVNHRGLSPLLDRADLAILMTARQSSQASGQAAGIGPISNPVAWVSLPAQERTFVHEVGHLLGCQHNREAPTAPNIDNFAFGWLIRGTPYHTIMSYSSGSFQTRLNYWSNSRFTINGNAMGNANNDNMRKVIQTRFAISRNKAGEDGTCLETGGTTCKDISSNCARYNSYGYCTRYAAWMTANCMKTCNRCSGSGGGPSCEDKNSGCPGWAGAGFCSGRYEAFMSANCRRSCKLC